MSLVLEGASLRLLRTLNTKGGISVPQLLVQPSKSPFSQCGDDRGLTPEAECALPKLAAL